MSAQIIAVDPFDLVVFGGTGDLARRKLMPGLYHRDLDDQLPPESRIIGASRGELSRETYTHAIEHAIREHVPAEQIEEERLRRFLGRLDHAALDAKDGGDWSALAATLAGHEARAPTAAIALIERDGRTWYEDGA